MKCLSGETRLIIAKAQDLLGTLGPMTLRHLFYLFVSRGVLDNSHKDYKRLGRIMAMARKRGEISFHCLVDNLRTQIKPSSWSGLSDFADEFAHVYRKDLWPAQGSYLEFWTEKDAIAGVLTDLTFEFDVRIRPLRGYSSLRSLPGLLTQSTAYSP